MIKIYNTKKEKEEGINSLPYPSLVYEKESGSVEVVNQDNIFLYTTTNGQMLQLSEEAHKYNKIISHTYINGLGRLVIDEKDIIDFGQYVYDLYYLKQLVLPRNLTKIRDTSYSNLSNLENVVFPCGLREIEDGCFNNCPKLSNLVFPNSLIRISDYTFNMNASNEDGIERIGNYILSYKNDVEESLYIPDGIISVSYISSNSLKSVYFPSSVRYIGMIKCPNIESIHFSEGLQILGDYCFKDCTALKEITIPDSVVKFTPDDECIPFYNSGVETFTFGSNLSGRLCGIFAYSNVQTVEGSSKKFYATKNAIVEIKTKRLVSGCKGTNLEYDLRVEVLGRASFSCIHGITNLKIGRNIKKIEESVFFLSDITTLEYSGTTESWDKIEKNDKWNNSSKITKIICSDGEITL